MASPIRQVQPGGREPAPEPPALMQDFCNTLDLEAGTDQLTGRDELAAWLAGHGLPAPGAAVAHEELEQALAVRAGLRELAMANAGQAVDEATVGRLNRALGPAALATIVVQAMHEGRWHRLKPCRDDVCRWLFYDHSTNRSGSWCTMAICGNRRKARTYRRRHRP
jgi:hypothetical protein